MKILHITSHLNVGGVTSYVLSLSKAFAQRGHRIIVASGGGQLERQVEALGGVSWRVPLATSVEFSPQVFAATRTLSRRLQEEPVELLHAHTRVGQVVADRLSRRHHIPYVTTWHGFFRPNLGRRLWPCTGDATIAISEPVRQHLLRDFHVPTVRVHLIPHGIDTSPFESPVDPAAQARLRTQLGLPEAAVVVGTMARLVASKGVDHLIRSFAHVRIAVPAAHLLIIGDGEERAALERLAKVSGLDGRVHFAGTLPQTQLALSLMSVFVFLPAEQEGFGLSLLEAMASGRPIVAVRRGGGAPWVLDDSGIGALVEPDDPAALGQAVAQVLRNGEAACRQAGQARAIVKERYSLSRMIDQVEAVYRALVPR
ncbi:MAG: glycosyltransferase family 4 protein [Candidatus Omnitrophica bacterium]|nr:glycosyltransferase family 4 protein [Candidatus Omnitrophota bacterium]